MHLPAVEGLAASLPVYSSLVVVPQTSGNILESRNTPRRDEPLSKRWATDDCFHVIGFLDVRWLERKLLVT